MSVNLRTIPSLFLQPLHILQTYGVDQLRPDVVAGLTVAVVLLPQAIAYALIAELPPQVGLYTAIVGAIVGALMGSSSHLQTGPTNAISLLVLSALLTTATPGTSEFLLLAGLMAVMAGLFQLVMGLARLGMLVNFVSHSVVVGFSSGAGVLIAFKQLQHLFGLEFASHNLIEITHGVYTHLPETHRPTLALGLGTIILIVALRNLPLWVESLLRWLGAPSALLAVTLRTLTAKLPGPLIGMVLAAVAVGVWGLDQTGVAVIGKLPSGLPPLAQIPLFNLELIAQLSTGALAVGAIGLVEAMSIARSIASQSGQRLDSNQEFVGQGLANVACGFLSGYPCSGSFTRSAVNFNAGAQTPVASVFSGLFVLIAMVALGPLTAFVPRAALAGVLIVTAYGMIDRREIARIWRGARNDAAIMVVTFLGTLFLHLEFAVLTGILLSFAVYIMKTSGPQIMPVLPDENFRHFTPQRRKSPCPQLAILDILGDLYFGAVSHIEQAISQHLARHPDQRFLLLRMHSVDQCDFSGIHTLENIVRTTREKGGDVFMVRVQEPVLELMKSTRFCDYLSRDHFLSDDSAIDYLFHNIIDPAICVYECEARAFRECQNLPKQTYAAGIPLHTDMLTHPIASISPQSLWQELHGNTPPLVIDVREPREFQRGHVPRARLIPLPKLLSEASEGVPQDCPIVFVCRGGRRSTRVAHALRNRGYRNICVLQGGMLAWEAAGLLDAID
ncbi:MAG: sulfate permease [Anaerolineales bacterium]|nr:MAG: sulfate permease [Anaerolineales bacterium]